MQHPSSLPPTDIFPLTSEFVAALQVPESHNHHYTSMDWVKVRVLGKGSFGVVYLAVPTFGNFPCFAVKSTILKHSSSLQKERRILEKLSCLPEIVECLGANIDYEDRVGFVYNLYLEYAAGGTLLDVIRSGGKLSEPEVQHYTRLILKGLCSIHEKGYVHCDLKPANILVFPQKDGINSIKIADFGLAKEPNETLNPNCYKFRFRGTPIYMPPESVAFGEIDTALDIWSLGCIVVEMFTGRNSYAMDEREDCHV
ncbi:hypothetical protein Patl1_18263 [Pistacia atlantica]|uniref:Uncharacterized protein n=1 Tax=Pistacia atlantica TaxID=434234 RepID=A0ACC1BXI7_9ROSI|nr:hypothetical protein Patl1_18263 [Pistacia atlantica]